MPSKRKPAREVAQERGEGGFWIDHARVSDDDIEWLGTSEKLTLWDVVIPDGFLSKLKLLWWLDIRGGSAQNLEVARDCYGLRYLQVNQVRGLNDLSLLPTLSKLEYLSLYGLSKVEKLPSLSALKALRRVELGQMKSLTSIRGALDSPGIEELLLVKNVGISSADARLINGNEKLQSFVWDTCDVPKKVSQPILEQIDKPTARFVHAIDWFSA